MDVYKGLTERLKQLEGQPSFDGIKAAARHIEIAEKHYNRAISERNDDGFNDVIYRTNQAFEGMLKEAYKIATGKFDKSSSPYVIEKYFTENAVFKDRIMQLLSNYRKDWRNPSTHDHSLVFDDDEALLAISSVSAFAFILLGDILERANFFKGQRAAQESLLTEDLSVDDKDFSGFSIAKTIVKYQKDVFSKDFPDASQAGEHEIIGSVWGYLSSLLPNLRITREMHLNVADPARADFVLSNENENIIIEVKRPTDSVSTISLGYYQIQKYLELANWRKGILFVPPIKNGLKMRIIEINSIIRNEGGKIYIVSQFDNEAVSKELNLTKLDELFESTQL